MDRFLIVCHINGLGNACFGDDTDGGFEMVGALMAVGLLQAPKDVLSKGASDSSRLHRSIVWFVSQTCS
jgi:hypothetical protein